MKFQDWRFLQLSSDYSIWLVFVYAIFLGVLCGRSFVGFCRYGLRFWRLSSSVAYRDYSVYFKRINS